MKLKTGIFIVLLVVLVACAGYINSKVDAYGYDTNFILETVFGDQGSLDGTEIRLLDDITNTCFWDSRVKFVDGRLITETSTEPQEDYIPHYVNYNEEEERNNIYYDLYPSEGIGDYLDYGEYVFDETKEMGDAVLASGKDELSIKPSDYCDYYKYNWIIVHNYGYWYLTTGQKKAEGDKISGSVALDENMAKFADFFKIPIVKDETYSVEKVEDDDEGPVEIYYNVDLNYNHEYFILKMKSAFGQNKAFLYFSNRTSKGNRVDTSQIPGGYGVYSFDFAQGVNGKESVAPDMDTLRVVLPLDENTIIKKIAISSDEKYLYVFTLEGKDLVLYIVDTETCEVASNKVLWGGMDEEVVPNNSDYAVSGEINIYSPKELEMLENDLFFAAQDGKGFRVIKIDGKDADVVFERDFDETDDPEKLGIYLAPTSSLKLAWDEGENKLTLAALKHTFADDESVDELNKTVVLVYKDGEPCYAGKITSDILGTVNLRDMNNLEEYVSRAEEAAIDYSKTSGGKDIGKYYWGGDDLERILYLTSSRIYSVNNE